MAALEYDPEIFNQPTIEDAMRIILTPEDTPTGERSTEARWEMETPWLLERMTFPPSTGLVIDYGCGIGRIARGLTFPTLGVDISWQMRAMSNHYCERPDFGAVTPHMLGDLVRNGLRAGGAVAVWSLQHAEHPDTDILLLARALLPTAPLYLVDAGARFVPHAGGWYDDGVHIPTLLSAYFARDYAEPMPEELTGAGRTFSRWTRHYGGQS